MKFYHEDRNIFNFLLIMDLFPVEFSIYFLLLLLLQITHMEMIKGIKGHGYYDELVIPIIENTAYEYELTESLAKAVSSSNLLNLNFICWFFSFVSYCDKTLRRIRKGTNYEQMID